MANCMLRKLLKNGLKTRAKAARDGWDLMGAIVNADADRGQVGFQTLLAVTTVFVLAMVAVVVADNLDTSIGSPTNTALSTAENDIITGFGDMASLIGVLFIVAIVVVIIFQLRRVQ